MPLDAEKLLNLEIPDKKFSFSQRDTMLYALGVGFAQDAVDENELQFTFEKKLKAVPTMAAIIGWDRSWIPATELNWVMVVHGEERLKTLRPLPSEGEFTINSRVIDVIDKGKDKGAILKIETTALDHDDDPVFIRTSSFFARGDGGFSKALQSARPTAKIKAAPDRAPDAMIDSPTASNSALIYRLSGDRNPLHSDPAVARAAGFSKPILHGLCSYGHACRAVLKTFCDYDVSRISSFDVRFSAPVYPGETLKIALWRERSEVFFEASVKERNVVVLKNGHATLT